VADGRSNTTVARGALSKKKQFKEIALDGVKQHPLFPFYRIATEFVFPNQCVISAIRAFRKINLMFRTPNTN